MTVPSTTQRIPTTERIILSSTRATPKTIITSITTTESRPITEDINVITEHYMKKNVKGSGLFDRFFKNKTSVDEITVSSTPISKEETEDYTTKEILENIKTTEESIGLATLPHDTVTNNIIDNDAASISPNGPIISTTTLKYVTIVDIIKDAMTSQFVKEAISDSTDKHYSSDKSEVDIVTNNVMTSTLSTRSKDLASENFTKKYERLRVGVDIAFSTTPNLVTDIEESTSENLQFNTTTIDIITSIRSDSGKDKDTESSTTKDLNYEESTATQYNATLINDVTRESSPVTINYTSLMDEKFSTTTKVKNVIKFNVLNLLLIFDILTFLYIYIFLSLLN